MQGSRIHGALTAQLFACVMVTLLVSACSPKSDEGGNTETGSAIQNTGSDTMVNVAQAWAESYRKVKSSVSVEVSGGGSGAGIKDLIQGTVHIANCSRAMKASERQQAIANNPGREPKEYTVGYDGIGVYVHKDNPLETITLAQLADIYKEGGTITKWSELGVDASKFCSSDTIVRFSRQSNSGTYQFFREAVLAKGDFKLGSNDLHGSKDVVEAVGTTPCSIGYSGMGYKTDHVKFVNVAKKDGEPASAPTAETVLSEAYPIARPLLMYTLGEPTGEVKTYLDWIFSPDGQVILEENGYVPLETSN
jgi:phosphate transport system substrate-binding protein